ncbi:MAG TPA: BBP7 family outer membrane beta-barrel protein [Pirellulaceae bacterium]|nr:BBP7 family outer membrane beta-barrel protein [Pirellulaceae bacterium]HMO93078.1 BBP7 family outer membrane beta-barrel protein [Pirellulaceae bacterium]HMP69971.1 BBP7 family outer membrane beta-barrel protein [Pirellulaceae bacterium]
MKQTLFRGIAMVACLTASPAVFGQYGQTYQSLLPNYPSAGPAYHGNQQGVPAHPAGYRQDQEVAPAYAPNSGTPSNVGVAQPYQPFPSGPGYGVAPGYAQYPPAPGQFHPAGYGPGYGPGPAPMPGYAVGPNHDGGCAPNAGYRHAPVPGYQLHGDYGYGQGNVYQSVVAPNCGGAANYSVPAYTGYYDTGDCGSSFGCEIAAPRRANWLVGVNSLFFFRSYENRIPLSRNAYQRIVSTDADHSILPGVEGVFGIRTANCWGFEGRYWGLFSNRADVSIGGMPETYLRSIDGLTLGAYDVREIYDNADSHRIYRDSEFHNVEFNFLRNAGCFTGLFCRSTNVELLAGFRYLRFDEFFRYAAFGMPPFPTQLNYDIDVRNSLTGFQLGSRTEHCISDRLRLVMGPKFGVFNNRIYHRQSIYDQAYNYAVVSPGEYHNVAVRDDRLAFIGELDLGLLLQVSQRCRLNVGYRIIGISGVALAPNQIPRNFVDTCEVCRINSVGNLFLHGAYAGLDFCF